MRSAVILPLTLLAACGGTVSGQATGTTSASVSSSSGASTTSASGTTSGTSTSPTSSSSGHSTGASSTSTTSGLATSSASSSSGNTASSTTASGTSAATSGAASGATTSASGSSTSGSPGCTDGTTLPCTTTCGSNGTQLCTAGTYGACVPPAETCNLLDDDCNGYCDDLLGCRVAVDRAYDSTSGLHFYTTTDSEASCCGYSVEAYADYYLYASAQSGLVPFYRCSTAGGAHLYTTDATCAGNTVEGAMGYISTAAVCGSVPLYGLYNATSGDYLYTLSTTEATAAEGQGYALQGTAGYVWPGACGGPNCTWPSPVQMQGSALTTVTGFPTAWYGFPISGTQSFVSLSGSVSIQNATNLYSEVLFILQYLPSGACQIGRWPASTPEYGPPGAVGIGQFIVKGPTQGTFTLPINLTLPGGLPVSSCLLLGLNGGPVAAPQNVVSAADLTLTYTGPSASPQSILGMGGEFCFGMNGGCQASTTDDSQSFASVTPVSAATQLVALYGDISDSTFDGTSAFGAPPAGAWTGSNDFYVYHGAECSMFGVASGFAGPGDYYASIPADATPLLSVPLSGNGIGVSTVQVFQPFPNTSIAAGDCLVTLWGLQGGGGFDNETQVVALVAP